MMKTFDVILSRQLHTLDATQQCAYYVVCMAKVLQVLIQLGASTSKLAKLNTCKRYFKVDPSKIISSYILYQFDMWSGRLFVSKQDPRTCSWKNKHRKQYTTGQLGILLHRKTSNSDAIYSVTGYLWFSFLKLNNRKSIIKFLKVFSYFKSKTNRANFETWSRGS